MSRSSTGSKKRRITLSDSEEDDCNDKDVTIHNSFYNYNSSKNTDAKVKNAESRSESLQSRKTRHLNQLKENIDLYSKPLRSIKFTPDSSDSSNSSNSSDLLPSRTVDYKEDDVNSVSSNMSNTFPLSHSKRAVSSGSKYFKDAEIMNDYYDPVDDLNDFIVDDNDRVKHISTKVSSRTIESNTKANYQISAGTDCSVKKRIVIRIEEEDSDINSKSEEHDIDSSSDNSYGNESDDSENEGFYLRMNAELDRSIEDESQEEGHNSSIMVGLF